MVVLLKNMSLDTESPVGKECEKQGGSLHGGHTAEGAVCSLSL
jgi:energy-converting hydrogenase Eha subunit B